MNYAEFLNRKSQLGGDHGFEPTWMPDKAMDFQRSLIDWSCRKGRSAVLADCGLGKTLIELAWSENVVRKTNGRVLIVAPLAVGSQTVREGVKFGVECVQCRDGKLPGGKKIIVTNYEKLHLFDPADFVACSGDEASILKHFSGATQKQVTRFMCKLPYRLLATATAAPNDYIELGTLSEALGELSYSDMLTRFFKQLDDKGQRRETQQQLRDEKLGKHFAKLSFRVSQTIGQWRLKYHAIEHFWRWVCSWARACRKPSDLGFPDDGFILPPLEEHHHVITPGTPPPGMLFTLPAFGLREERDERRRTLTERCEFVANLVNHNEPAIVWCHLNYEGDLLEQMIPGSVQVAGADSDEHKEKAVEWFLGIGGAASQTHRVLISKSKIFGYGLNLQCCAHVVTFVTHSWESHYQSIRRCYRFGQTKPVRVDIVATKGEERVRDNLNRKAHQAELMFEKMIGHMNNSQRIERIRDDVNQMEVPKWLSLNKS